MLSGHNGVLKKKAHASINSLRRLCFTIDAKYISDPKNNIMDTNEIDGESFYNASLELAIQTLAETRAMTSVILNVLSQGNPEALTKMKQLVKDEANRHYEILGDALYREFGYLPPNILGQED